MNSQPNNPRSIIAQNVPPTRNIPEKPPVQPQESSNPLSNFGTPEIITAATCTTAAGTAGIAYMEQVKHSTTVDENQKQGLRNTFASCVKNKNFKNFQAIYNLKTHGISDEEIIRCLKSAKRLDTDTHYVIEGDNVIPFAKTNKQNKVTAVNKTKSQKLTEMNKAYEELTIIDQEADQIMTTVSPDQAASLSPHTDAIKRSVATGKNVINDATLDILNPQKEGSLLSSNEAKKAVQNVDFSVKERDNEKKALLDETQTQNSQTAPFEGIAPKKEWPTGSGSSRMAAISPVLLREKHCSVAESAPTSPSNLYPYASLIKGSLVLTVLSGCLFIFFRENRLKKNEKQKEERQHFSAEKASLERKSFSDILFVLKNSNFLTILHNYKMQKINLREAKDLLSANFGLSDSEVLSILNNV